MERDDIAMRLVIDEWQIGGAELPEP